MEYRNAKYIDVARIDCEIEHPVYGWIPFTCDPTDVGAEFDAALLYSVIASDPATGAYTAPTQSELDEQQSKYVRSVRNKILDDIVDRVVCNPLRWSNMSMETQAAWTAYRQTLLDVTQQSGFPHNVAWPIKPE